NLNKICLIKLCDYTAFLYENAGDFDLAYKYIIKAGEISDNAKEDRHYLRGIFYEMASQYYDFKLDGNYYGGNERYDDYLKKLNKYSDKSIYHMRKSDNPLAKPALARYLIGEASILMRSKPEKQKAIIKLLNEVKYLCDNYVSMYSETQIGLDLAICWYYTYVEPDADELLELAKITYIEAQDIYNSDLALIDEVLSVIANTLYESELYKESINYLYEAIRLCNRHEQELPYIRIKKVIYSHLLELATASQDSILFEKITSEMKE
nr:hypothetical protein [Lachnospiraceae bacterium]